MAAANASQPISEESTSSLPRLAAQVWFASCVFIFFYFWIGSLLVANGTTEALPLHLPAWDEFKWWLGRPDTGWYFTIIEGGYQASPYSPLVPQNWAFFPAYPLLVRMLAFGAQGEPVLVLGWALSVMFYGLAVWILGRLVLLDFDRETAQRVLLLLCFYPFAYSMAIFGPDSLFLFTVCLAFYGSRNRNWWLAGAAAAVACATRVQGLAVLPCLLLEYCRERDFLVKRLDRQIIPILAAPIALVAFAAHLWRVTGNPLAFAGVQQAWGNQASYPFAFLVNFLQSPTVIGHGGWDPEAISVTATCLLIPLLLWCWRRRIMRDDYLMFFALQVLLMVSHTSALGNPRYILGCFPCFVGLACATNRPLRFSLTLALFAGILGLMAALFATGMDHRPSYHFTAF